MTVAEARSGSAGSIALETRVVRSGSQAPAMLGERSSHRALCLAQVTHHPHRPPQQPWRIPADLRPRRRRGEPIASILSRDAPALHHQPQLPAGAPGRAGASGRRRASSRGPRTSSAISARVSGVCRGRPAMTLGDARKRAQSARQVDATARMVAAAVLPEVDRLQPRQISSEQVGESRRRARRTGAAAAARPDWPERSQ